METETETEREGPWEGETAGAILGSPDEAWGSGQAWGEARNLGGWRRREGASRAGVPRAAGGRRAELGPAASAEPGAGPATPRRDVSGATLKGAGRPPRVGAGAGGRGHRRGARSHRGSPSIQLYRVPETQEPAGTTRRWDSPRKTARLWSSVPSKHTDTGTPSGWPAPMQGLHFPSALGERPHLGGRVRRRACWDV